MLLEKQRQRFQHLVARWVTELVIDNLEMIDVDHHYGKLVMKAPGAFEFMLAQLHDVPVIKDPRQSIGDR